MRIKSWVGLALIMLLAFGTVACKDEGAGEKMGKALDEAAADAAEAGEDAKKKVEEAME